MQCTIVSVVLWMVQMVLPDLASLKLFWVYSEISNLFQHMGQGDRRDYSVHCRAGGSEGKGEKW